MSTIKLITIAAITLAVIGLLTTCGLYLRGLHGQIADLTANCTTQEKEIAIFTHDAAAATKTVAALQAQVTEYGKINVANQRRIVEQLNIIKGFTLTDAKPLIDKKEVIDYETSRRVIDDLNNSFVGAWMQPAASSSAGTSVVRTLSAPPGGGFLPSTGRTPGITR